MQAGEPDRDPATAPSTLAARLGGLFRTSDARTAQWEAAATVAILLALVPLATIAGAKLLTRHENTQIAQLRSDLAPRLAAEQAARTARNEIGPAIARPPLGTALEALSRALPADASLSRAERTAQGALEFDVTTTDPDKLRAAIRRVPELAGLRDSGQRQSDGAMIVSLRQDAP